MSGHSKWSTIKHKKAAQDAKRGKIFTKIIKELTVAARLGGGDADANPRLRTCLAAAKAANMPADNIKRAIQKGTGELPGVEYEEVTYEGYGPGGVAILIETMTDNRMRTTPEIRHIFSKHGGNMGEPNSVAWMFQKVGRLAVPADSTGEDALMDIVLEAGAEDLVKSDDVFEVVTAPESFHAVQQALESAEVAVREAALVMEPQNTVELDGKKADQCLKLLDVLDDQDDVQNVWANLEIQEGELESSAGSALALVANRRSLPPILGIDPGSRATGWALVEGTPEQPRVVACGVIRTRSRQAFADRLAEIQAGLATILEDLPPALAAVEAPFHGVSARSALQLAHARGVILATLSRAGIAVEEYSPAQVKKSVTGSGRATKAQVAFMVERLAGTRSSSHDLTDAVAVALCHQAHRPFLERAVEGS